jgi:hypothetical protein
MLNWESAALANSNITGVRQSLTALRKLTAYVEATRDE